MKNVNELVCIRNFIAETSGNKYKDIVPLVTMGRSDSEIYELFRLETETKLGIVFFRKVDAKGKPIPKKDPAVKWGLEQNGEPINIFGADNYIETFKDRADTIFSTIGFHPEVSRRRNTVIFTAREQRVIFSIRQSSPLHGTVKIRPVEHRPVR